LIRKNSSNAVGIQYFREYSERRAMSEPLFPRLTDPDDGEAIRVGDGALSYRELAAAAATVADRVSGAGRVAVWAEPSLELCVAVIGALAAGVSVVPINPGLGSRELEHIVTDSAPERLLARPGVEAPEQLAELERIDVERVPRHGGGGRLPDEL